MTVTSPGALMPPRDQLINDPMSCPTCNPATVLDEGRIEIAHEAACPGPYASVGAAQSREVLA